MRIAFDGKRCYHNRRGLGNYSRDLVRLMVTYAPENEYFLLNPSQRGSIRLPYEDKVTMVLPQGVKAWFPSLWRSKFCVQDIERSKAEVYHGLSGELPWGIERIQGLRKLVTVHDALFVRYPELYSSTYGKLFREKVQYACDKADTIVAISEQTKRDCIEFFHADERKIRVVYQGCSNIFREKQDELQKEQVREKYGLSQQYLLDVGAIEPRKNLERLLRALQVAKIEMPLVVVGGRSKYAEQMKRLAAELGLEVYFLHEVAFQDFPALYQQAFALCYPSIFEGFGIPILEGMCSGVPVLTSTGSCFSETGGDAALYANPLEVDDIAEKLQMLWDESRRMQMVAKGQKQAERFTDVEVAKQLCELYQIKSNKI